jgi:glutaminase
MGFDAKQGPVMALLHEVWQTVRAIPGGQVADYIPELAKADPQTLALSLATLEGAVYTVGDLVPFTIQSVSKPFVYALALADSGSDAVLRKVGAEPTGDPFNSISLDDVSCRAYNPMVNAGAIVTATLVGGATRELQFQRILEGLSAFAGRSLAVDEQVYASERDTGDRNRAIAYLMRSAGLLEEDVDEQVEMYFRQCSILVTAQDLAVMAATLANAGVNPTTGEQVVPRDVVAPVLTVMSTCGMYDSSGEWLYRVGLPAKSGVSGAVVAALPGQLGLAAHSPRLDARGNSVRGVAACEEISSRLGLHLLLPTERTRAGIRRSYRGDSVRSKRIRRGAERAVLASQGAAIAVHELAGDQEFAGIEILVRMVLEDPAPAQWLVFDMRRVSRLDVAAQSLLHSLIGQLREAGTQVALVEPKIALPRGSAAAFVEPGLRFGDIDGALEWCENALLDRHGITNGRLADGIVPMAEQDLMAGLPAEAVAAIERRCTTKVFTAGTVVFEEGDPSDGLYFVAAGLVSADLRVPGQRRRRRLSSSAAGTSFGELALIDQQPRSTRIVALDPTVCYVLSPQAFRDLQEREPQAGAALTLAMARSLSQRLRASTTEVAALEAS